MKRTRRAPARPRKKARVMRKARMTRAVKSNLVSLKRRFFMGIWTPVTGGVPGIGQWNSAVYQFQLNALPNYTEFTALFDEYKINAVKLTFVPAFAGGLDPNTALTSVASGGVFLETPRMYTLIDRDGDIQVSTENAMLENNNARIIRQPNQTFSIYIAKPNIQFEVATTALVGFAKAASKGGQWLDTANAGVVHHGCAVGCHLEGSSASQKWQVIATYYMQFRHAK